MSYLCTEYDKHPSNIDDETRFAGLTEEQVKFYSALLNAIKNNKSKIMVLDAPPGTGKTFLLKRIFHTIPTSICYSAYTRELCYNVGISLHPDRTCMTTCKLMNYLFDIGYVASKNAWVKFSSKDSSNEAAEKRAASANLSWRVVVVDEYTVLAPLLLKTLMLMVRNNRVVIIFAGDRCQQAPIQKSKFEKASNYSLITNTESKASTYTLTKQMRVLDADYSYILNDIRCRIIQTEGNVVALNFKEKVNLIRQLGVELLLPKPSVEAMYLSQYHKNIKRHVEDLVNSHRKKIIRIPFVIKNAEKNWESPKCLNEMLAQSKFIDALYIHDDFTYLWQPERSNGQLIPVKAKFENGHMFVYKQGVKLQRLQRLRCSHDNTHPELMEIFSLMCTGVYQFPIRHSAQTYHAIQGKTIECEKLELDLDAKSLNAIYVGLSRVRRRSQLGCLLSTDKTSIIASLHYDDGCNYQIPRNHHLNKVFSHWPVQLEQYTDIKWKSKGQNRFVCDQAPPP